MKTSQDRILTTHTGSLPRGGALSDILVAKANDEIFNAAEFETSLEAALNDIIARQIEAGIDIGNDGEMPRTDFISYITERMSGFGRGEGPKRGLPLDAKKFPIWFENIQRSGRRRISAYGLPQAIGPLTYDDTTGVETECRDFKRVLANQPKAFTEGFMTAVSPGFAATAMVNLHYDTFENYVFAMARALKAEYEYIASQGFILQIDSPDMGIERSGYFQDSSLPKFIAAMEVHVAALNMALVNIPRDQIRFHACWGNRDGPHYHDVPCPDILPVMFQVKAGALVLPFANARHSHEIEAFQTQPLPDHMSLVVGSVETTNNYVEHPMVVAERLVRAARCVGDKTRIMAGTDCGFGTFAGDTFTAEDVVWAKLESLVEGSRLASKELWG
ncbi:MAG: methionine synthase [Alphaproteobacteria bacterium]|nr:methionine synthase [Alphaproteobacteria bacterium]